MTELTGSPEAAQPSPDWPRLDTAAISDPMVAQALARLDALPKAPVAEHEAAYSRLHDQLLEALNAEPGSSEQENVQATDNHLGGA
jgi:hypothetical protein